MNRAWLLGCWLMSGIVAGQNLGVYGTVYPIAETDMRVAIQHRLRTLMASGRWQAQKKQIVSRIQQHARQPMPVQGLVETTHAAVHFFDPTVRLEQPIRDARGTVLIPAGTAINPLRTVSLSMPLVFLDARSARQRRWAQKTLHKLKKVKIILTGGDVFDTATRFNQRVYFDQRGALIKHFHIQQVPATVSQAGYRLRIEESVP